jgi:hypothetical protein
MPLVTEKMDLTPKVPNKAITYEELNTDDKYAEDDFTTPSKKIIKSKTSYLLLT